MGPSEGSWWFESKSDPRWDGGGRGKVGMFYRPEAEKYIEGKTKELGKPPADLEYGFMKD